MAAETPINFIPGASDIPAYHLPDGGALFLERALRFRQLATGHAMRDYLRYMDVVAMAQHQALAGYGEVSLPAAGATPPLLPQAVTLTPAWRSALGILIDKSHPLAPEPMRSRMLAVAQAAPAAQDALARDFLEMRFDAGNLALMPLVGAALQVHWAALLAQHQAASALPEHMGGAADTCPMCGALPVAGLVRSGGASQGLRYLVCSLCPTQWHMERVRCVHCGDSEKLAYYAIEDGAAGIEAETCDACHGYTKLYSMEKQPQVDVFADDLASFALDALTTEAGYRRYGYNPFLITLE